MTEDFEDVLQALKKMYNAAARPHTEPCIVVPHKFAAIFAERPSSMSLEDYIQICAARDTLKSYASMGHISSTPENIDRWFETELENRRAKDE